MSFTNKLFLIRSNRNFFSLRNDDDNSDACQIYEWKYTASKTHTCMNIKHTYTTQYTLHFKMLQLSHWKFNVLFGNRIRHTKKFSVLFGIHENNTRQNSITLKLYHLQIEQSYHRQLHDCHLWKGKSM